MTKKFALFGVRVGKGNEKQCLRLIGNYTNTSSCLPIGTGYVCPSVKVISRIGLVYYCVSMIIPF